MKECGTGARIRRGVLMALAMTSMIATGCGGGGGGGGAADDGAVSGADVPVPAPIPGGSGESPSPDPGEPAPIANGAPSISASPMLAIAVGSPYSFTPEAADPDGDSLAFAIENRPEWAEFSTVTGELSGTPTAAGSYADITISVSDGQATATLAPFTLTVNAADVVASDGGVALQWEVSSETIDGSALGELAGFRIHYGLSAEMLSETIELQTPGLASYVIDDLPPGTYYFAVRAVSASGAQSPLSNIITKVVS